MRRSKLKRKWLVILTIILTVISLEFVDLIKYRINYIKKEVEQCDNLHQNTCSTYQINQHFKKNIN